MKYKRITVKELQENIEQYVDLYDKGDDTHYIIEHDGKESMMVPYDGPWEQTVKEDENGQFIEFPNRLLVKMGWKDGENLNMEICENKIILKKT